MGRSNRDGQLRKKITRRQPARKFDPQVYFDRDSDYASIKIAPGVEARSYEKDGFIFCEDKNGKVIEIQVLNFSDLAKKKAM